MIGTLARCATVAAVLAGCAVEAGQGAVSDEDGANEAGTVIVEPSPSADGASPTKVFAPPMHAAKDAAAPTPAESADAALAPDDAADGATAPDDDAAPDADAGADADADGTPVSPGVEPPSGSVEGGTRIVITGNFPGSTYTVSVGGVPCSGVTKSSSSALACVTAKHVPREVDEDVVVSDAFREPSTIGKFHYFCPWIWRTGAPASCGAAPPAHRVAAERASSMLTFFQRGDGFNTTDGTTSSTADTNDYIFGSQSLMFATKGGGQAVRLGRTSQLPVDFTKKIPKLWLRLDGVAHAKVVELHLGSSASDYFVFRIAVPQEQQWATEGDWVSPSLPFGGPTVGTPDRSAIRMIEVAARDDGAAPVTVHLNGLGMVDEPTARYPKGLLSFTFDDGYATQLTTAAPIMTRAGFTGTAYVITQLIGTPSYLTTEQAVGLQTAGWDVGVHSFLKSVHSEGYPATSGADLEADIVSSRAWLMENGLRGYDHCAYPHGAFTGGSDVLDLAHKYFTSCRSIFSTSREATLPSDAEKLRVYLLSSATPMSTVQARIDEAVMNHEWVILVFHDFSPGTPPSNETNQYSAVSFQGVVDYVKSSGIAVKPVSEVLAAE